MGGLKTDFRDCWGAVKAYSKTIENNTKYTEVYNFRGLSQKGMRDYNVAISGYTKAIQLNPNNATAYSNRADA
jgi:hypothetical protein